MSTAYKKDNNIDGYIPLSEPEIRGREWDYIKDCLDTNWVSSAGAYVDKFEQIVASSVGLPYGVATVNGTAALHIALLVAGVKPGDEVLASDLTFIAPINAIRYVGAWPVLVDSEPRYWQLDPQRLIDFLEKECRWRDGTLFNRKTDRKIAAIIPVHILGHPVEMQPIIMIAQKYGLVVIEDATESLGVKYNGDKVGSIGDLACFSFNGNKLITTGGGGMIVTANESWAHKARYLTRQAKDDPIEYIHTEIGFNYRLTNLQAAMGCAQMESISDYISRKRSIAATYNNAFRDVPGITPLEEAPYAFSVFWLFSLLVEREVFGINSRDLMRVLESERIQSRPLWQPIHRSLAHKDTQAIGGKVADELNERALSLPCSVGLTELDQERVIEAVLDSRGI